MYRKPYPRPYFQSHMNTIGVRTIDLYYSKSQDIFLYANEKLIS